MNKAECEDKVLSRFKKNGFYIAESVDIHPSLKWQPPIRVIRTMRGRVSDAIIIVQEDSSSIKQNEYWHTLDKVRSLFPNLSIYFVIPDGIVQEPLVSELQELSIGLYLISDGGVLSLAQADRVPFDDSVISYPIVPNLPYRNQINLYKVFDHCTGYLWWLDQHFISDGFELLHDWCQCENHIVNVTDICILGSSKINTAELKRLKHHFSQFQVDLGHLDIQADIRVITNTNILKTLHDRYIISDNIAFKILPVGSLIKGQYGSLSIDENFPDFKALWDSANEL